MWNLPFTPIPSLYLLENFDSGAFCPWSISFFPMKDVAEKFPAGVRTSLWAPLWWWCHWYLMCRFLWSSHEARIWNPSAHRVIVALGSGALASPQQHWCVRHRYTLSCHKPKVWSTGMHGVTTALGPRMLVIPQWCWFWCLRCTWSSYGPESRLWVCAEQPQS